jgi:hypothetical protein
MLRAICAEASFEKVDNAAMLELAGLNLKQIVGEGEQPEGNPQPSTCEALPEPLDAVASSKIIRSAPLSYRRH